MPLFVATTIRTAIFARVAIVPDTRMARMALARLDRHKPFAAVLKPLERDGGKRIRCQKAAEHQSKSDKSLLHIDTPMFLLKPLPGMTQATQKPDGWPATLRARADEVAGKKTSVWGTSQATRLEIDEQAQIPATKNVGTAELSVLVFTAHGLPASLYTGSRAA